MNVAFEFILFMRFSFCVIAVLVFSQLAAQESAVFGTNPASLKWYRINTPHFRLLYPQGFETQAERMANTLESIREPEAKSIGELPRKISVILQSQSAVSNGFVSPVPRRVEFYGMPSQDYNFTGTNDWLNMLASHEYRHVAQYQHARRGLNKFLYYIFGGNTFAGLAYAAAPPWFWEGDAVATETAFTNSGRGRIPNFDLLLRTNIMEGRSFNYHKQFLESYKNNISNWYVLGYHMVSYLRKKTNDPMIWDKVTAHAWNVPFIPFRFSSALKKETGLYVTGLYNEMASNLQADWKKQLDTLQLNVFEKVNKRTTSAYTDYKFPQELNDGSILARKSGIGDIETLVSIKEGSEQKLFTQGVINDAASLSANNDRVVWNEFRFDPRWQVRTYSVIVGFDLKTNERHIISKHSRYASAAISPDGNLVTTIETTTEYKTHLVVLDYFNGNVVTVFDNPDNDFISMPHWRDNGKEIVALVTNKNGRAIVKYDLDTKSRTELTPFTKENLGYPVPFGDFILYNSPISGIDNIYAIRVKDGARFQITSSKYGAYNPMVSRDGKWIYYNEQSRDGLDVVKIPFNPVAWKTNVPTAQPDYNFGHLVKQEGNPSVFNNLPSKNYESKRYYRWKGIFNPYTWGLTLGTSLTDTQLPIGITSQDILSTSQLFAGMVYDRTEKTWTKTATVSYQGWYPIINFSFSDGSRNVDEGLVTIQKYTGTYPKYTLQQSVQDLVATWNEKNVEGGLSLPLNTTTSKYYGNVTIGNAVGFTQASNFSNSINGANRIIPTQTRNDTISNFYVFSENVSNGKVIYDHFSLSAYRLLKQSHRDINSKWGQELFVSYYNTPFGGDYTGKEFSAYGVTFLPGLFKHHSLWGYWGYQYSQIDLFHHANKAGTIVSDNNNYQFRNQIPIPRGSLGVSRYQNFYSASANYTLPVWYPDIALGPLLNIQRIRANGFFDYGFGSSMFSQLYTQTYMSAGIEVKFDVNVMRLLPQLDIGFRITKGLTPSTMLVELLLGSINL